jgi:hypothetical protein
VILFGKIDQIVFERWFFVVQEHFHQDIATFPQHLDLWFFAVGKYIDVSPESLERLFGFFVQHVRLQKRYRRPIVP